MAKDVVIVVTPPAGTIDILGTSLARGVWPDEPEWEHSLVDHGALRGSCTLNRRSDVEWPDLQAFTLIEIWKAGVRGFVGRILQTPSTRGKANQITIQMEGLAVGHLKDAKFQRTLVLNDLTAWKDARSFSPTNLATYTTAYDVVLGGEIRIGVANGTTVPNASFGGVTLDLGPYSTAKRVVVTFTGGTHAGFALKWLAGDTAAAPTEVGTLSGPPIAAGPTTAAFTLATARRFVTIYMDVNANTNVALDTAWAKLTNVIVFSDTAYESGNASILRASAAIPLALPYAPKISQSAVDISPTFFNIPHHAPAAGSVQEWIDRLNAYHLYQWFLKDPSDGSSSRLVFRPVPTTPTLLVNVGAGKDAQFADSSRQDGGDVYNSVLVEYTDYAGNPALEERTTAGLSALIAVPPIAFDTASALATISNPSFDVNVAGWTNNPLGGAGAALTRDTGVFDSTPASGRLTAETVTAAVSYTTPISGLAPGRRYRIQVRAQLTATGSLMIVSVTGTGASGSSSPPVGSFSTTNCDFTATAATHTLDVRMSGTAGTNVGYFDTVKFWEARPTIVDRQGFVRTQILSAGARLTQAAAQQIGDVYLQAHRTIPLRGTLSGSGAAIRALLGDVPIPAHLLSRYLGEGILINETDPDTGAIGRFGIISSVRYIEKTDAWEIAIDNNRDYISALLDRLSIVQGGS